MTMKICRECEHHQLVSYKNEEGSTRFSHECRQTNVVIRITCPVTGELRPQESSCFYQRERHGLCGPYGKLWEKKNDDRIERESLQGL